MLHLSSHFSSASMKTVPIRAAGVGLDRGSNHSAKRTPATKVGSGGLVCTLHPEGPHAETQSPQGLPTARLASQASRLPHGEGTQVVDPGAEVQEDHWSSQDGAAASQCCAEHRSARVCEETAQGWEKTRREEHREQGLGTRSAGSGSCSTGQAGNLWIHGVLARQVPPQYRE